MRMDLINHFCKQKSQVCCTEINFFIILKLWLDQLKHLSNLVILGIELVFEGFNLLQVSLFAFEVLNLKFIQLRLKNTLIKLELFKRFHFQIYWIY